jgi:hypothetical protein
VDSALRIRAVDDFAQVLTVPIWSRSNGDIWEYLGESVLDLE